MAKPICSASRGAMKRPRAGAFLAQIDGLDLRHVLAAEPRRQRHALIAPLAGVHLGLHRRRRRGQHDRDLGDRGPHHRHVAGVIMRAVLLLVGLVVLLIDDHQAELGIGQKQRRARPHHHRRLAAGNRRAIAGARPRRQLGMPFQRARAEAGGEAVEKLPGQRDLRHQDQDLLAALQHFGDRLEIDFGLARSGDAVEQRHLKPAGRRARAAARPQRVDPARNPARRNLDRAPAAARRAACAPPRACRRRLARRSRKLSSRLPSPARIWRAAARPKQSPAAVAAPASAAAAAAPTRRTPNRTRSGPRCSPIRSVIRSTWPRGDSV